jgi:hypothetical protein
VGSPATTVRPPTCRSRITNGKELLPVADGRRVDGRSAVARRYQDLIASLSSDAGGEGQLSEARRQFIRRFAALAVLAENIEARLAMGQTIDLAEHCTVSSTLVRLAPASASLHRPHRHSGRRLPRGMAGSRPAWRLGCFESQAVDRAPAEAQRQADEVDLQHGYAEEPAANEI